MDRHIVLGLLGVVTLTLLVVAPDHKGSNLRGTMDIRNLQSTSSMKVSGVDSLYVSDRQDSSNSVMDTMIPSNDVSEESHTSSAYNSHVEKETFLVFDPDH